MTPIGVGYSLPLALVECSLKVLQTSTFSQVGQTRLLQGMSLGSFSCDGSMQGIHVPAAKIFPLLRSEWLWLIFLVGLSGVASTVYSAFMGEARGTARSVDHQDFRCWITAIALGCSLYGASRTGRREIRRARLPQLGWWPSGEPPRVSPTAEASTDPSACAGGRPGVWSIGESTDMGSTVAAAERRGHMRENASHRGRGAHQRRVEPPGATRSRRR